MPWRRKWQPTPVLLPGKPHEQRSLRGYSKWLHEKVRHKLETKQQYHILSKDQLLISLMFYVFRSLFQLFPLSSFISFFLLTFGFTCSSSRVLSYSFIWNIFLCCLILPTSLFLFLFAKFNTVPGLSEVALCRRHLMGFSTSLSSGHQIYMSKGGALLGYVSLFVIVGSLLWTQW